MPEGDTIFRAAEAMHRVLAGRIVTRFESVLPALARVDQDRPIAGRTIESVVARGKHLLMSFTGDLILHTHMRMSGSWHLYRPGDRWKRPARNMRVLIATADAVAVGFDIPVAELLTTRELDRHVGFRRSVPTCSAPRSIRRRRSGGCVNTEVIRSPTPCSISAWSQGSATSSSRRSWSSPESSRSRRSRASPTRRWQPSSTSR